MAKMYNTKQEQVLESGKELFWKYGFKRVTIEEICREAGVSKMTFYKYFPNKSKLAMAILDRIFDESILKIKKLGEEHEDAGQTLEKMMQLKFEGSKGIGEEFVKDLYTYPEAELKTYMETKTQEIFTEVIQLYEKGQKDGWVRKDLNIPFMIQFTRSSMDILVKEDLMPYFNNYQEMILEVTRLFIYGIAPHE
jgi:AcrR family transcriptional regulator